MKKELKRFKRLLSPDYPACSEGEWDDDDKGQDRMRQGILKITLHILRQMNQADLANTLQTSKNSLNHLGNQNYLLELGITWNYLLGLT